MLWAGGDDERLAAAVGSRRTAGGNKWAAASRERIAWLTCRAAVTRQPQAKSRSAARALKGITLPKPVWTGFKMKRTPILCDQPCRKGCWGIPASCQALPWWRGTGRNQPPQHGSAAEAAGLSMLQGVRFSLWVLLQNWFGRAGVCSERNHFITAWHSAAGRFDRCQLSRVPAACHATRRQRGQQPLLARGGAPRWWQQRRAARPGPCAATSLIARVVGPRSSSSATCQCLRHHLHSRAHLRRRPHRRPHRLRRHSSARRCFLRLAPSG